MNSESFLAAKDRGDPRSGCQVARCVCNATTYGLHRYCTRPDCGLQIIKLADQLHNFAHAAVLGSKVRWHGGLTSATSAAWRRGWFAGVYACTWPQTYVCTANHAANDRRA